MLVAAPPTRSPLSKLPRGFLVASNWESILALLRALPDDERDEPVGVFRLQARGERCEEFGDWAGAAAVYGSAAANGNTDIAMAG